MSHEEIKEKDRLMKMMNRANKPQLNLNFVIVPGKSKFTKLNQNFAQYNLLDEIEHLPDTFNVKLSNGGNKLALAFVY